jgi:hypothetical protein
MFLAVVALSGPTFCEPATLFHLQSCAHCRELLTVRSLQYPLRCWQTWWMHRHNENGSGPTVSTSDSGR